MTRVIINLPLDKTGRSPDNLMMNESVVTTRIRPNIRVGILEHGGFYGSEIRVYDKDYNRLVHNVDFVFGYYHINVSELFGLKIYSAIVLINEAVSDNLYVSAQMVGGDSAYSFTVLDDYTNWVLNQPADYVPQDDDYTGVETVYEPGTLEKLRWKLDTYQPFNNEIDRLKQAVLGLVTDSEENFRSHVRTEYQIFKGDFEDRMKAHVENLNNPHKDVKGDIGLKDVLNYPLASKQEAELGIEDKKYLTPKTTWDHFNFYAKPLVDQHLADLNNPHELTREQIKALSKAEVLAIIDNKYFKNEVVTNSRTGNFNGDKNYATILAEFRKDLPPSNFTTGLVAPQRLANSTPGPTTVITSGPNRWTNWKDIVASFGVSIGTVTKASFSSSYSRTAAHNFIASNAAYHNLPNNSLVLYSIYTVYASGNSNGTEWRNYRWVYYASIKNSNGAWVAA